MRTSRRWVVVLFLAALAACGEKTAQQAAPKPPPQAVAATPAPSASEPAAAPAATASESAAAAAATEAVPTTTSPESAAVDQTTRALSLANKPWHGDFDRMLDRKVIRVLVPYSRTLYFIDKGTERGITAETVRDFETYINRKYRKDKRPVTVVIIPTTRDKLLPNVAAGLGDIAAGNITVTESRLKLVDFYAPDDQKTHEEWIVTGPGAPALATLDDLSGKTVAVRRTTSYYENLLALNQRFASAKKAPVQFEFLPDALEDPDILEMTNAGVLDIVVVDNWETMVWGQALPNIKVHKDMPLRAGEKIGWAIRKGSPQLAAAIEDFRNNHLVKQGVAAYRLAKYQKRFKQMTNPTQSAEYQRFQTTVNLFRQYGSEYGFDPIMLAAQGYQESQLDQNAKSHVGAIGVMQLMPATGKEMGVGDIRKVEVNIHAGTKYMDQLMERYFKDAKFDAQNRSLFAFAAYNAGPGRIQQMRELAASRGYNPDVWFNNVEIVTAEKVGAETTTYVRNIYKYYASYKLVLDAQETRRKATEAASKTP